MTRRNSTTLALLLTLSLTATAGVRGTWRGMVFETADSGADTEDCTLVDGSSATGDVVVPPTIYIDTDDGSRQRTHLTAIGKDAFRGNTAITSATFSRHVDLVADGAFAGCEGLMDLTFRRYESAPAIEGAPFDDDLYARCTLHYGYHCAGYKNDDGWKDFVNRIELTPVVEFAGGIYELVPPPTPGAVYNSCLIQDISDCQSENWTIPMVVEGSGYYVHVTGVGDYAAYGNPWLKRFYTDRFHSVQYAKFGAYSFGECHNLEYMDCFQIKEFGEGCFMNSPKLKKMSICSVPDDAFRSLPAHCFDGCPVVEFPFMDRVTSFGDYALRGNSMTSLTIRENVKFGIGSFSTPTLMSVTCEAKEPIPSDGPAFSEETYNDGVLYVHYSCIDKYVESKPNWCRFKRILAADAPDDFLHYEINPDGKTCTLTDGSKWKSDDSRLVLPSLVTLTDADGNPASYTLTAIADRAFYYNNNLRALIIPETVTTLGKEMLYDCRHLAELDIKGPVTVIPDKACFGCDPLSRLSLPNTVTYIGYKAISCCYDLVNVEFPSQLKELADYAFYSDKGLKSVTLPDGVTTLGDYVFAESSCIESITIPGTVQHWGKNTFASLVRLKNFVALDGVTELGEDCFYDPVYFHNQSLNSATLPPSLRKIGRRAFKSTPLNELTLYCTVPPEVEPEGMAIVSPSGLTLKVPEPLVEMYKADPYWGQYKIVSLPPIATDRYGCVYRANDLRTSVELIDGSACKGDIIINGNVELTVDGATRMFSINSVADGAFAGNKDLTGVTFCDVPFSILPERCFAGCTSLARVNLPSNLNIIRNNCFDGCEALTDILLPENMGLIKPEAFSGCSGLQTITLAGYYDVPQCDPSVFDAEVFDTATLRLCQYELDYSQTHGYAWPRFRNIEILQPDLEADGIIYRPIAGATRAVVTASPDASGAVEIPKEVSLKQSLYYHNYKVTGIEARAFEGNDAITSVKVPAVKDVTVGEYAFSGCHSLTSATLPYELTELEEGLFAGCTALTEVELSSQMVGMGTKVFSGCSALEHLDMPSLISNIGEEAFAGCTSLLDLKLPVALREIAPGLLRECSSLSNIMVPLQVGTVGSGAFSGCTSLAGIILPASVSAIESEAFGGCDAIKYIKCFSVTPCALAEDAFTETAYRNAALFVPEGESKVAYTTAPGWRNFFLIYEDKEMSGFDDMIISPEGDNGTPEIYDLKGQKITGQPAPGIYILRTPRSVRKVIF